MSKINWSETAPHRADWEHMLDLFNKAGLPSCRFVNGEPVFEKTVSDEKVLEAINAKDTKKHKK